MIHVKFRLEGPAGHPRFWTRKQDAIDRDLVVTLGNWSERLVNKLSERAPKDKGALAGGFSVRFQRESPARLLLEVRNPTPQAWYVEFGTGVYSTHPAAPRTRIRPKSAKALVIPFGRRFRKISTLGGEEAEKIQAVGRGGKTSFRGLMFRDSIAGQPAQPFIFDTFREMQDDLRYDVSLMLGRHGFNG